MVVAAQMEFSLMDVIFRAAEVSTLYRLCRKPARMPAAHMSVTHTLVSKNGLVHSTARQTAKSRALFAAVVAAIAKMRLFRHHFPIKLHNVVPMKMINVSTWSKATRNTTVRRTPQLVPTAALVIVVPGFTG
jgi:hypothetical protein